MNSDILREPPKYFRAAPPKTEINARVDREGGYRKAGVIRDVSLITEGEALGHGLWIDQDFLEEVSEAVNMAQAGVKSRFTHPSMSGDGLGRFVGRVRNATSIDGKVIADQHFSESGHNTPDGDLAGYLMSLAEEDPMAYGLSIVFDMDMEAMEEFLEENSLDTGEFVSPSLDNENNYPHARLKSLRAVDAVDEPAANPDGLFHRETVIVEQATAVASFALGLSDDKPSAVALGLDADRVRGFVTRFLTENALEIRPMSDQIEKVEETVPVEEVAEVQAAESEPVVDNPEQGDKCEAPVAAKTGPEFVDTFGDKGGVWFALGKTWEEALDLERQELREENASLKQKLSAAQAAGEDSPVDFRDDEDKPKKQGFAGKISVTNN